MSPRDPDAAVEMIRAFHPVEALETRERGVLTVACTGEWPTDYVEDGRIVGIHGEVRRRVAEILGLEAKPVPMVFADMIAALDAGEIDVPGIGTAWTEQRSRSFQLTQPFQYFFFGIAQRDASSVVQLPAAAGRSVTALEGSFNNEELAGLVAERGGSLSLHEELAGVVEELESGASEVAIYDHPNIELAIRQRMSLSAFRVGRLKFDARYPLTTGRVPCHLVLRGDAHRLAAGARLALDLLRSSGELTRLYARYGSDGEELLDMTPA